MAEIIVVGGGAAGMMAAIAASGSGHHVILLEKNEKLGKKLFITGKGRCNVTNAADPEELFANVCTNPKFLYSAFYGFDNRAVMELIEGAGCPLKTERGGRVFPVSDHSSDVIAALKRLLDRTGVEVRLRAEVSGLWWEEIASDAKHSKKEGHTPAGRIRGVCLQGGGTFPADAVIVCTGGLSYASTGSTGDGMRFAGETGHDLVECSPSLVPLETAEDWCRDLMGLSLKNVELSLYLGDRELYREQGEMLFTHFGVSGPLVLTASCYLRRDGASGKRARKPSDGGSALIKPEPGTARLSLDLKPALSEERLDKRLLRDMEEQRNKCFKNALGGLFPTRLIPVMVMLSGIDGDRKVNEITREERRAFARLIKHVPLTVTGTRSFAEAIITRGGVSVKEISPGTMESKRISGLYFAGEVLDLDARTGGYNLQIAWSTGRLAGESAARALQIGQSML
ncbi:MAG: NAD(P)/FAD-dependent oxidoreductase [Clostridium sp.]|nr:NAD(P)/FAD-dependent oxidoreductase [Acetatifactor muris]MCM1527158.1 NAD(P)/FAD-dependent oxidoreductase [Bacteroides sp.]MCM1562517.1 NAD(P)/FAD-dependent oxidoreductase [Clostridium sp.]